MTPPQSPSWFEHVDLMQVAIVALILTLLYFVRRWIDSQVQINKDLYDKFASLSKEFYTLQGEHNSQHHKGTTP